MSRSPAGRTAPPRSHSPTDALLSALGAALIVLVPGLAALATGRVLLFPSLGPSALHQALTPEHPSSRAYNVLVAHLLGVACGFAAVYAFGLVDAPSVFVAKSVTAAHVGAAVTAVAAATLLEIALHATHPPAASTTLLITLGTFKPTAGDVTALLLGVLIVAVVGELCRRLRLRQPHQHEPRD